MNIKLMPFHFKEILRLGYSLDQVFLLKMMNEGLDVEDYCKDNPKLLAIFQSIDRKGLLVEDKNKLNMEGQALLVFLESKEPKKMEKKKVNNSEFDLFWASFPGVDTFYYKGTTFSGCRSLRQNKEECRIKFQKILLEGEHSADDIIKAMQYDVLMKKEQSIKTRTNKLTYMQNSLTYLNQRSYEGYMNLIKSGNTIKTSEEKYDGVNI